MINEEQVKKNAARYFSTVEKYGLPHEEMAKLLGIDFIIAPATTSNEYFRGYEGGLIEHILSVTTFAVKINETLPDSMKVDKNSLLRVCLLHQIGKAKMFKNKEGYGYTFSDSSPMRTSEKSIQFCYELGIKLTDEEASAIYSQDRSLDDKMPTTVLADLIKTANMFAIKEFKLMSRVN